MSARALDRALRGGMAGLLLGLPLTATIPARAAEHAGGAVPDSATMARIRAAAGEHGVRVIGTFGQRDVHHPVMDSTGVWSAEWVAGARPAVFATSDAPHAGAQAPLPWGQIQEIKSDRQHKTHGALLGAGLGLVAGAVTLGVAARETDELTGAQAIIPGCIIIGGVLGLFIGSLVGAKTIYRSQENP